MIAVSVLGSTGSVGRNTLDVLARHRDRYRVAALAAGSDAERLREQCRQWQPDCAALADAAAAARLRQSCPGLEVLSGAEGIAAAAALPQADCVVAGIVGAAGLLPTLAAVRAGKRVILANKEALVMTGGLLRREAAGSGARLLPIDSEHNAVFQCLPRDAADTGAAAAGVRRILLTASGGPFLSMPPAELEGVTPERACQHPNWAMGRKISIDSATMMNKGLEVIEACLLFDLSLPQVDVLVHPRSIVHSLVEYRDGSVLAQLASPDLRIPIAHALAWPGPRIESGGRRLDLLTCGPLVFEAPDPVRFPCLRLAREAMREGGTATAILNAANEVAVDGFLKGQLRFTGIAAVVEDTLEKLCAEQTDDLERIMGADAAARRCAGRILEQRAP